MDKKLISVLFISVLMVALDISIIGPALPTIHTAFNVQMRDLPWVFNIFVLMTLVSTPLLGKLSDIYGRRVIYILGIFLFGFGSFLIVISDSYQLLLIGRGIQGFGAGGIFPITSATIGDVIPKEKQGSVLGLIGAVFGLAFIIGPIVGGLLLMVNWHWIFAINLPIAVFLMIAG
ncbi:MAG: MFS transporter, partial [Bacteroidales bacterium]|nr:MFS transporter [Bacteroidales bacterium]